MSFFDKLVGKIHTMYEDDFSKDQIQELLSLDSKRSYDTLIPQNKSLNLRLLEVRGIKDIIDSKNGEFKYPHEFKNGVNLLLADNNKGKSSLFKIIKLALTGSDNIKTDVRRWVKEIYLEFRIDVTYTIYIDLQGTRMAGRLYKARLDEVKKGGIDESLVLIDQYSESGYITEIEKFFFNEFGFYQLNWTQKNSAKNRTGLVEAGTSWKTYFSSIFLESKDYNKFLFGNQNEKILEMLLGLQHTYPINRLSVKKDKLKSEASNEAKLKSDQIKNINPEYLQKELTRVKEIISQKLKVHSTIKERDELYKKSQELSHKKHELQKQRQKLIDVRWSIEKEIQNYTDEEEWRNKELQLIGKESARNQRRINSLKEDLDAGKFFSNLDVEFCPNCDNTVKKKVNGNECYVCHQEVKEENVKLNPATISRFENEIQNLEAGNNNLQTKQKEFNSKVVELARALAKKKQELDVTLKKIEKIDLDKFNKPLRELNEEINKLSQKINSTTPEFADLYKQQGVLEHQLGEYQKKLKSIQLDSNKFSIQQNVLESAILYLKSERQKKNQQNIKLLEKFLLYYLHAFRVLSITDVHIDDSMGISFVQHGADIKFKNMSEGEQLKAKLSLYLSLIKIGIQNNIGRHPKLMIIDTPGKEEGDSGYLNGLKESLSEINSQLGDKVQIIVGTALRELEGITTQDKSVIFEINEPVF